MPRNPGEQWKEFAQAAANERDSKQIADLIEQLDRDLEETQKNAREERLA